MKRYINLFSILLISFFIIGCFSFQGMADDMKNIYSKIFPAVHETLAYYCQYNHWPKQATDLAQWNRLTQEEHVQDLHYTLGSNQQLQMKFTVQTEDSQKPAAWRFTLSKPKKIKEGIYVRMTSTGKTNEAAIVFDIQYDCKTNVMHYQTIYKQTENGLEQNGPFRGVYYGLGKELTVETPDVFNESMQNTLNKNNDPMSSYQREKIKNLI